MTFFQSDQSDQSEAQEGSHSSDESDCDSDYSFFDDTLIL